MLEAWIEALKSGKYKQGFGQLRNLDDKYCCLGVACEVMGMSATKKRTCYAYNDRYGSLTKESLDKLGIDNDIQQHLVGMNDRDQKTFEEIAEYLCTLKNG